MGRKMTILKLSYYPDITQKQSPADVRNAILVFANSLGEELTSQSNQTIEIETLPVMSVSEQFRDLVSGGHHIALMKPVAYVFAHRRRADILPACVAHRPIDGTVGTSYFAQIYANAKLCISTIEELASLPAGSLRMAYGDRFSTSNFLIPANILQTAGIDPFLFFKSTTFYGGHDFAAEAVYKGDADIGGGHDGVIKILSETQPDAEEILVRLKREFIHSDPVVVDKAALLDGLSYETIQTAITTIAKQPAVHDALDLFWGWVKNLSPTEHSNYRSIEDALERLGLDEYDMLN